MKKYLIHLLVAIQCISTFAQNSFWHDIHNGTGNYNNIVERADAYFSSEGSSDYLGRSIYEDWKYRNSFKVDRNGNIRNHNSPANIELKSHPKKNSSQKINSGTSWTELGPRYFDRTLGWTPGIGRVNDIIVNPGNPEELFACTEGGGIWKKPSLNAPWELTSDNLAYITAYSMCIDPDDSQVFYLGTKMGGILVSEDMGQNWENTGLSNVTVNKLLFHPENSSIIFAATNEGIYKSTNKGNNFKKVNLNEAYDIEFHPTDPNILYAGSEDFLISTDLGESFSVVANDISTKGKTHIAVSPDNPDRVYVAQSKGDLFGYIYKSDDRGTSFELVFEGDHTQGTNLFAFTNHGYQEFGQAYYNMAFVADPNNADILHIAGANIWKSTNGGESWILDSYRSPDGDENYVHAFTFNFIYDYLNNKLYAATDGGLFRKDIGSSNWQDHSDGLRIAQIHRIGVSQSNPDDITISTKSSGCLFRYATGIDEWRNWTGDDGGETFLDKNNADHVYASASLGRQIYLSEDRGRSLTSIDLPVYGEPAAFITPFAIDPLRSDVLFVAFRELYRSTDFGQNWFSISSSISVPHGEYIDMFQISTTNPDYIYLVKDEELHLTTNGGDTWTNIVPNNMDKIAHVEIHPTYPNVAAYVTYDKVFLTLDAGNTWSDITRNLPDIGFNCLTFEEGEHYGIFLGTQCGVFYTSNNQTEWVEYNEGFPKSNVRDLEIQYQSGKLRAATFGRGAWEAPIIHGLDQHPFNVYHKIPGAFNFVDFDLGGEGIAYHDNDASNNGGQYRNEGVDIELSALGGHNVGWIFEGEWLEYSVYIEFEGEYDYFMRMASPNTVGKFHFELDDEPISDVLDAPYTNSWQLWTTFESPQSVYLESGFHVLKLYVDGSGFNVYDILFTPVDQQLIQRPYNGDPIVLPAKVQAEQFDFGGEEVAYHETTEGNIGGQLRPLEDVDIGSKANDFTIGWIETGEWLEYTVECIDPSPFLLKANVSSPNSSGKFHIEVDGEAISPIMDVPNTGDWGNYRGVVIDNFSMSVGTHIVRFYVDHGGFNLDYLLFNQPAISNKGCSVEDFTEEFSYTLEDIDGAVIFTFNSINDYGQGDFVMMNYSVNGANTELLLLEANEPFALDMDNIGDEIEFNFTYYDPYEDDYNISGYFSHIHGNCFIPDCDGEGPFNEYAYNISDDNSEVLIDVEMQPGYGYSFALIHYSINGSEQKNYFIDIYNPYVISDVEEGDEITFHFTYTLPDNTQRFSIDHIGVHTYTVGTCFSLNAKIVETNEIEVSIAPNPFREYIEIESNSEAIREVAIYNEMGERVFAKKYGDYSDTRTLNLNEIENPGIYFVHIRSKNKNVIEKIIKDY